MINTYNKVCGKQLNCVDTNSGVGDLIMVVNTILDHMKLASFVKGATMIAIMGAFSSIGMLSH